MGKIDDCVLYFSAETKGSLDCFASLHALMRSIRNTGLGWRGFIGHNQITNKNENIIIDIKIEICDSKNFPKYYPLQEYRQNLVKTCKAFPDVTLSLPLSEFWMFFFVLRWFQ